MAETETPAETQEAAKSAWVAEEAELDALTEQLVDHVAAFVTQKGGLKLEGIYRLPIRFQTALQQRSILF